MPIEPDAKQAIRERVWSRLAQTQASPDPHGRIPEFVGAAAAAERLAELPSWQQAWVIKANPDQPQLPVRVRALREGKLVYMAVPKLADPLPFFRLDPAELGADAEGLAAHRAAATRAPKTAVADMLPVDLVVCGTVAVNPQGVRLGKGAGYSDIEVGLLAEAGLIGPGTTIVTTVHQLQVVDEPLPHDEHDFTVDYIITPKEIISCGPAYRPTGLLGWCGRISARSHHQPDDRSLNVAGDDDEADCTRPPRHQGCNRPAARNAARGWTFSHGSRFSQRQRWHQTRPRSDAWLVTGCGMNDRPTRDAMDPCRATEEEGCCPVLRRPCYRP